MCDTIDGLFQPLQLPCGATLRNRIVKSAMSDSLGDGTGHPTEPQKRLYERWAEGGVGVSIIGEVQGDPGFAEKPGNLVLDRDADLERFRNLARRGGKDGTHIWPQLGHAGAMAYPPTSTPKGPSALDLPGLKAAALGTAEIAALPGQFAQTARLAREAGFSGVQIHAAHGFLLSQFLSPLFNRRDDAYGDPIGNRMRLLLDVVEAVRRALGADMPIAVKLNASDQLDGGLDEDDALAVVAALDRTGIDLIDISGGTYFPGAKPASENGGTGPYFLDFARRARQVTEKPLMATGGFKTLTQASDAVSSGTVDLVGLARGLALCPDLPTLWQQGQQRDLAFPRFDAPPEGGVTAWYTMRLTAIGEDRATLDPGPPETAINLYEARDRDRTRIWRSHFTSP
jgi:2,4-dienoyl-CoA reductase-like NADH-dependent reductase (Old Yellow Enzyme family)